MSKKKSVTVGKKVVEKMSHINYRYTDYFSKTQKRSDRRNIKMSDVYSAIEHPEKIKVQDNNRISVWKFIPSEKKYLRVITLKDGRTIHNAYYDRDEKKRYIQRKKNERASQEEVCDYKESRYYAC